MNKVQIVILTSGTNLLAYFAILKIDCGDMAKAALCLAATWVLGVVYGVLEEAFGAGQRRPM